MAPIMGIAIVIRSAKNGQLELENMIYLIYQNDRDNVVTHSNTKNSILVPVINATVKQNTPEWGAVINLPSQ